MAVGSADSFVCELSSDGLNSDGFAVYNSPQAVPADKTYFVKELEAPKGYEKNEAVFELKDSARKMQVIKNLSCRMRGKPRK